MTQFKLSMPDLEEKQEIIDAMIDATGRDVIAQMITVVDEDVDYLNDDPFSAPFYGVTKRETIEEKTIKAVIAYKGVEERVYRPEGIYFEGDVAIMVHKTSREIINKSTHFIVDGDKYIKKSITPAGWPEVTRYYVALQMEDNND